ncbi:probable serine/threonine-protein kinase MARK-A [Teleopsis dalmanni]|uniref:probable serine/threonine-protein kinase MARK-A n=1 Tax=Teleopsis dalmanni TaxID=139649 RepID=UPI0018CD62D8|nr:probable serine/threonine-protein kinase MARK-A [Teleopsis dalmanni]
MVIRTQHLPYNVNNNKNNNMSATATNLTNTTTKTTTGLSNYFLKKKRKLFLFKFFDTFNCAKETDRVKLLDETSQQPNMPPTVATTKQTAVTRKHSDISAENERLSENCTQVCLICRQEMVDSCIECGQVMKSSKCVSYISCMNSVSSVSSINASHRSHNTNTNDIPSRDEEMMYINRISHLNNKYAEFDSTKQCATTTQLDLHHQQHQQQQQPQQHHCQSHPHHHCHCNKKCNKLATVLCNSCCYKNKRQYSSCPTTTATTTLNCLCKHFCKCSNIANANETASSIAITTNMNITNKEMIPSTTVISIKSSTTSTSTSPTSLSLSARNTTTNAIPLTMDHPMNASLFDGTTKLTEGTNIKGNNNNIKTGNSPRSERESERKPSLVYRFLLITLQYMQIYMRTHVNFFFNKRQQCPPLSRLIFLYNSYSKNNDYNNYNCNSNNYHLNNNAKKANNKMAIAANKQILKASQHKHTQKEKQKQRQQHPQHKHHSSGHQDHDPRFLSHPFKRQPYLSCIDQLTRSLMYLILIMVALSIIVPTTQAQTSHQSSTATGTALATGIAAAAAAVGSTTSQVTLSRNETGKYLK